MATVLSTIICDDIRLETGNKHSFMGVYDGSIKIISFPFNFQRLAVSQLWGNADEIKNFTIKIEFENSEKPAFFVKGQPVQHEDNDTGLGRFMINLNNIRFSKESRITISTYFNDEKKPVNIYSIVVEKMLQPGEISKPKNAKSIED